MDEIDKTTIDVIDVLIQRFNNRGQDMGKHAKFLMGIGNNNTINLEYEYEIQNEYFCYGL